jgi:hypothetical protein
MPTNRTRHLSVVVGPPAVLVALAAAVALTSIAAAGPDAAKRRAISQKGVRVKLTVFANFKAPRALSAHRSLLLAPSPPSRPRFAVPRDAHDKDNRTSRDV